MEETKVPQYLVEAAQSELAEGEMVRWIGQPTPILAAKSTKDECLGGLFMTVFFSFFTWVVFRNLSGQPGGNAIIFIPVAIGFMGCSLYALLAPLRTCWLASRTVYVVTDLRAFSIVITMGRAVRSFSSDRLATHECQEDADSRGSIIFYRVAIQRRRRVVYREVGFIGLPNVREVSKVLVEVSERAGGNESA